MWLKYPALCFDPSPKPTTIEDALRSDYPWRYLTLPQIRELAIDLGVMPDRNRRRKREIFVELLLSKGATEEIVGAAMAGYHEALADHKRQREDAQCEIMAHTLAMRTYTIRDWGNYQRLKSSASVFRPQQFESDCPVEQKYAAAKFRAAVEGLPPFFPGARTSIRYLKSTLS